MNRSARGCSIKCFERYFFFRGPISSDNQPPVPRYNGLDTALSKTYLSVYLCPCTNIQGWKKQSRTIERWLTRDWGRARSYHHREGYHICIGRARLINEYTKIVFIMLSLRLRTAHCSEIETPNASILLRKLATFEEFSIANMTHFLLCWI